MKGGTGKDPLTLSPFSIFAELPPLNENHLPFFTLPVHNLMSSLVRAEE